VPSAVGSSIRAGDHDGIAIRVAQPTLPVVGAAFTIGRIAVAGQHDLDAHFGRAPHYGIEVIDLEPEKHTIAVRFVSAIPDGTVMMFDFKTVQLQHDLTAVEELFVLRAAMAAGDAEQALIPAAAAFDIRHTDERLGSHSPYANRTLCGAGLHQAMHYSWKTLRNLSTPDLGAAK
jgi:hypothetical protein